jgi:nitrate/nitrite-specific signal transduction histidine kinase
MNHKQLNQKISELNQLYADLEACVEEEKEQRGRELNPEYIKIAESRLKQDILL